MHEISKRRNGLIYSVGEDAVKSEGMHGIVSALGGRLTELELLVQKMKMGMDAESML